MWRALCVAWVLLLVACAPLGSQHDGALSPVTAKGNQLRVGWRSFEVRGVNYIHPSTADTTKCASIQFGADNSCPWDIAPIRADMARLHTLNVNTVRVFLDYYVFGGARAADPSYSIATPLAHLDALIAEANAQDIYVIPVLMAKYPQDRFGPDAYSTALDLHVRPVVQHLAGRSGILMWDLFNEIDIGSPVDQRCWDWDNANFALCFQLAQERLQFIKAVHDEVKALDPQRLTTVSLAFAKNYFKPANAATRVADIVDVFTFHYYDNDPYDSGRYAAHWYYGKGFPTDLERSIRELHELNLEKPIVVTELGFPTGAGAMRTTDQLHQDLRAALASVRNGSASGMVLWPFQPMPSELPGNLFTQ